MNMIDDEAALLADIRFALRGLDPWPPKGNQAVRGLRPQGPSASQAVRLGHSPIAAESDASDVIRGRASE
jgi:hypothetical protein